ncbi:hypothetical protein QOZ88_05140 [Blastococcus sp. BMG 814]|uniref:Inner membrane protein n=1 Tax=Blastococcus carthaginiensis TaxID=3050034 RepID=A0ABT9I8X7_9ACTN|nr:hypothetical protein [Blastococcus carthaginiensis]MDP5182014.1 hypothetical protein [Blastococcus carthaginiensis]
MGVIDLVGWFGSALLVYSLLQTRVLRFRVLNLLAALVLVGYNAVIAVWPMVAMNVVIAAINAAVIWRLQRHRHDVRSYDVVPIGPGEPYLRHVLERHRQDIRRFHPHVQWPPAEGEPLAFLVLTSGDTGGETAGVVLAHRTQDRATARIDVDYVLPRYRDFTPGEFVYRPDGPFAASGVRRVLAPRDVRGADAYLARTGFRAEGEERVLTLAG